jgi:hypothetical protein
VAGEGAASWILRRALSYPYAAPDRSYLYCDGRAAELPARGPDLVGRTALLSYGANASPEALARKLVALPGAEMPVLRARLTGFDVAYSAHVSLYGAVPGTLVEIAGTAAPVFVAFPTAEQLRALTATEAGNYELVRMGDLDCRLEGGGEVVEAMAYRSRRGALQLDSGPVALMAIRSRARRLPELAEPAILERVRAALTPSLTLEAFVLYCVELGGVAPLLPI